MFDSVRGEPVEQCADLFVQRLPSGFPGRADRRVPQTKNADSAGYARIVL